MWFRLVLRVIKINDTMKMFVQNSNIESERTPTHMVVDAQVKYNG